MSTKEMVTSFLEVGYVDRAKLNALLQALFGQRFNVVVAGDTIAVEASRELTEAEKKSVWLNKRAPAQLQRMSA